MWGDESLAVRGLTGGLLVVVPVAFTVIFVALGTAFEYPDILSAPNDVDAAGAVNAVAYAAWALWLVIVGVRLLRAPATRGRR